MSSRTINPNRTRVLHEALAAAVAARAAGQRAADCARIAANCREQWAKRLCADNYTCQQHHIDDGLLVWVATGPCGCRFEYAPTGDGRTDCLSNSGETYCIEDHHGMWTCGCEAFDRDGRHCKHLAGWAAVRTAARTHTAARETPPAPVPVKSWETPEYHAMLADMHAILG